MQLTFFFLVASLTDEPISDDIGPPSLVSPRFSKDDFFLGKIELLLPVEGRGTSFNNTATDCGLKEDTPKAMNCPPTIIPYKRSITGKTERKEKRY